MQEEKLELELFHSARRISHMVMLLQLTSRIHST
jgi:hypothetical protein